MAMSSAAGFTGTHLKTFTVIASADADTGDLVIPHGFGAIPRDVSLVPLLNAGILSNWSRKTVDATNITVNKGATTAGSGNAAAQLEVQVRLPHSLVS